RSAKCPVGSICSQPAAMTSVCDEQLIQTTSTPPCPRILPACRSASPNTDPEIPTSSYTETTSCDLSLLPVCDQPGNTHANKSVPNNRNVLSTQPTGCHLQRADLRFARWVPQGFAGNPHSICG